MFFRVHFLAAALKQLIIKFYLPIIMLLCLYVCLQIANNVAGARGGHK